MSVVNPIEKHSATWLAVKGLIALEMEKARVRLEDLQCPTNIADVQRGKIAAMNKILALEDNKASESPA